MKALISPKDAVVHNGTTVGLRIIQVQQTTFPVAEPMRWVDVPDGTTQFDMWDGVGVVPVPVLEETPPPSSPVVRNMSRRQFFRALHAMGITEASVQDIVDQAPVEVQIDYRNFVTAFENDTSLMYVFQQLGRPPQDLTTFFNIGTQL